ncbi:iron-sulfur cluster assembly protein [Haloarchaeobius sp. DYHT-AS-18]|uniref:iron-sulfur cluster assembly protein n=1 Tax=Haloarchaeobius sp. DYHT-AS-18 TaxID=3446117 RepID=UPI003EB9EF4A
MAAQPASTDGSVDPAAVEARLDRVDDPELDRSIVDLEYVERVTIADGHVTVVFVLPTAWCSPAFAWMMATGIRDEVGDIDSVAGVTVSLLDHMHSEEITTGINERRSFAETFPDAESGVAAVRRKLDEKARLARQHRAVEAFRDAGLQPAQIVDLTLGDLDFSVADGHVAVTVQDGSLTVTAPREPVEDYLEKARTIGLVTDPADRCFRDPDGDPIAVDEFDLVQHRMRAAAVNVRGQGTVCEGLHESRNRTHADD